MATVVKGRLWELAAWFKSQCTPGQWGNCVIQSVYLGYIVGESGDDMIQRVGFL
jgi:hypothetical protein